MFQKIMVMHDLIPIEK